MLCNYIHYSVILLLTYDMKFISCDCNNSSHVTAQDLPLNWPCEWNNGTIPYTYNFFLYNPRRLVSIVERGVTYVEKRSCLTFKEDNPTKLATIGSLTYLYFTYSDVLESCCFSFSRSYLKRRIVLITPLCTLPVETAHTILHGMGLSHEKRQPFFKYKAYKVLYPNNCTNMTN